MLPIIPVTILVVALVVAIVMLYRPVGKIIRITSTPTTSIGLLPASGAVEIAGYVDGETLTSPIAHAAVVFWQLEVQELRSSGKSRHWRTIYKQSSTQPLRVTDGTGSVAVAPGDAEVTLTDAVAERSRLFAQLSPDIEQTLERYGIPIRSWLGFRKTLRVFERHLVAGQDVFVLGTVERFGAEPVVRSRPGAPLIVADRPEGDVIRGLYLQTAAVLILVGAMIGLSLWLAQIV